MLARQQTLSEALKFRHQIKYPYQIFRLGFLFVVGLSKSTDSILDFIKHYWVSIISDEVSQSQAELILNTCPLFEPLLDVSEEMRNQIYEKVRGDIKEYYDLRQELFYELEDYFSNIGGFLSYIQELAFSVGYAGTAKKFNLGGALEAIGNSVFAYTRLQMLFPGTVTSLQEVIVGEKGNSKAFLVINADRAIKGNVTFTNLIEQLKNETQAFVCDAYGRFSGEASSWPTYINEALTDKFFLLSLSKRYSEHEAQPFWPLLALDRTWPVSKVYSLTIPRTEGDLLEHFLIPVVMGENTLVLRKTHCFVIPPSISCELLPVGGDTYFKIEAKASLLSPIHPQGGMQMRVKGVSALEMQAHIDTPCTIRYDLTLLLANYWHMFALAAVLSFALPIVRVNVQKNNKRKRPDFFCKKNIAENVAMHSAIGSMIMMGLLWRHNQPGYLHITALLLNVTLAIVGQLVAANCFEKPKEPLAEHKQPKRQRHRKR